MRLLVYAWACLCGMSKNVSQVACSGDDTYQTPARFLLAGATGATIPIEAFVEIALVRH